MKKYVAYAAIALALASVPAFAAPSNSECGKLPACVTQGCDKAGEKAADQAQFPAVTPDSNADRSAIPDVFKWNRLIFCKTDAEFYQRMEKVTQQRLALKQYRGKLGDPKQLKACLDAYFATEKELGFLAMYAKLGFVTNLVGTKEQVMADKAQTETKTLTNDTAFMRQEVLALSDAQVDTAYKQVPELKEYKPWIDEARRRAKRVLSPQEERILALAQDNQFSTTDLNELPSGYEKTFDSLRSNLKLPVIQDEKGQDVQLTWTNFNKYRASEDRRVRRDTVEKFFGVLNDYRHTFASLMAGQIEYTVFLARSRGYNSALEAYLDRDNIPVEVYRNVVNSVKANTKPLHRLVQLRKKVMGLDDIHIYDLYTPLVPGVKSDVPYETALNTIPTALASLGPDYCAKIGTGLDSRNGWIDVYPHKDKESGAFCVSSYGQHPFVLVNYQNEIDDMSTLAHEYGHAMHTVLTFENQPMPTASYVPFVAEVASTCNEKILSDYLIAHAKSDDEKLYLLTEFVNRCRGTIYRQALFADWEMQVHAAYERGESITADYLNKLYADLIREYYGPDFTVDENDGIEWAYIPHLYYKFYVFSYSAGMTSGIAIADRIEKEGAPARDAYLKMLSSGSSKTPVELLKIAGVDITKPDAFVAAANAMDKALDQIEDILRKQGKLK